VQSAEQTALTANACACLRREKYSS